MFRYLRGRPLDNVNTELSAYSDDRPFIVLTDQTRQCHSTCFSLIRLIDPSAFCRSRRTEKPHRLATWFNTASRFLPVMHDDGCGGQHEHCRLIVGVLAQVLRQSVQMGAVITQPASNWCRFFHQRCVLSLQPSVDCSNTAGFLGVCRAKQK